MLRGLLPPPPPAHAAIPTDSSTSCSCPRHSESSELSILCGAGPGEILEVSFGVVDVIGEKAHLVKPTEG